MTTHWPPDNWKSFIVQINDWLKEYFEQESNRSTYSTVHCTDVIQCKSLSTGYEYYQIEVSDSCPNNQALIDFIGPRLQEIKTKYDINFLITTEW